MSYQLLFDIYKTESFTFCSPFGRHTGAAKQCRQHFGWITADHPLRSLCCITSLTRVTVTNDMHDAHRAIFRLTLCHLHCGKRFLQLLLTAYCPDFHYLLHCRIAVCIHSTFVNLIVQDI